jgi:hypothetical protein
VSKTLLVVHHTPSPTTRELLEAVLAGANDPEIDGVDVVSRPALAATICATPVFKNADGGNGVDRPCESPRKVRSLTYSDDKFGENTAPECQAC